MRKYTHAPNCGISFLRCCIFGRTLVEAKVRHQQVGGTLHQKAMKYHCYEIGMGHKDRI